MQELAALKRRIKLLKIDDDVIHNVKKIRPVLYADIDAIIHNFYKHVMSFPDCRKLLDNNNLLKTLPARQRSHWLDLFSCRFDEDFAKNSFAIGRAHFQNDVAPFLYIAGYTFFHCQLIKAISDRHAGAMDLASLLMSVARVVNLDMDLALSAYTREYWSTRSAAE